MNEVIKAVMPKFESELSESQIEQITATTSILEANNVEGIVRDRAVARYKSFLLDCAVKGQELFKPEQQE